MDDRVRFNDGRNKNGDVIAADVDGSGFTSVVNGDIVMTDIGGHGSTGIVNGDIVTDDIGGRKSMSIDLNGLG